LIFYFSFCLFLLTRSPLWVGNGDVLGPRGRREREQHGDRMEPAPIREEVDKIFLYSHRGRTMFITSIEGKTTWFGADQILPQTDALLTRKCDFDGPRLRGQAKLHS
jgi:hypothetical protein